MANIYYGNELAQQYNEALKEKISLIEGRKPKLAVILVGDNPASHSYVRSKEKACAYVGIETEVFLFDESVKEEVISFKIQVLNEDKNVDGILLQLPLPEHLDKQKLINAISPDKDVDGLHTLNVGFLWQKQLDHFIPCTPLGCIALLEKMGVEFSGKKAVVVGRSNLAGLPMANLLLQRDCTVTICHSKTVDLKEVCQSADIIVSATGVAHLIKEDYVKEGAYVVDVGISKVDGKIVGDVDFDQVKDKCAGITPMPKGTGPMTVAMLLSNTYKAYQEHQDD